MKMATWTEVRREGGRWEGGRGGGGGGRETEKKYNVQEREPAHTMYIHDILYYKP